ncbi:MAG: DUF3567 family protein [Burkholderiaceae bacterium]
MEMIYNSATFCVVEIYADGLDPERQAGFEIMDKASRREAYIDGALAERFREEVAELAGDGEASVEDIDDYLATFQSLMRQPMSVH